jgi:hypothetical protein
MYNAQAKIRDVDSKEIVKMAKKHQKNVCIRKEWEYFFINKLRITVFPVNKM